MGLEKIFNNGSAAIIESGSRILLNQRDLITSIPYPGHWQLFGGHAKDKEDPIETLLRELKEELGKQFKESEMKFLGEFKRVERDSGIITIYYHQGNYTTSDFRLGEGHSMAFVNINYLPKMRLCPDMKDILSKIYGGNHESK